MLLIINGKSGRKYRAGPELHSCCPGSVRILWLAINSSLSGQFEDDTCPCSRRVFLRRRATFVDKSPARQREIENRTLTVSLARGRVGMFVPDRWPALQTSEATTGCIPSSPSRLNVHFSVGGYCRPRYIALVYILTCQKKVHRSAARELAVLTRVPEHLERSVQTRLGD